MPHAPFSFISFLAKRKDDNTVMLNFETINEYNSRAFTIERLFATGTETKDITQSADTCFAWLQQKGILTAFVETDSVYAKNRQWHTSKYRMEDKNNYRGFSFYRITERDNAGNTTRTDIIAVIGKPLKESMVIYPNPAKDKCTVRIYSRSAGKAYLEIINSGGTKVKEVTINIDEGNNTIPVAVTGLSAGVYVVKMLTPQMHAVQSSLIKVK